MSKKSRYLQGRKRKRSPLKYCNGKLKGREETYENDARETMEKSFLSSQSIIAPNTAK